MIKVILFGGGAVGFGEANRKFEQDIVVNAGYKTLQTRNLQSCNYALFIGLNSNQKQSDEKLKPFGNSY